MQYVYIDGDDIGLKIEKSFMTNNEAELRVVNVEVNRAVSTISNQLKDRGFDIIFCGADGIICKKDKIDIKALHSYISDLNFSIRFSVGIGNTLREAFLALRYAKSNGKNGIAIFEDEFKWIKNV
ncbi:mCpol domain-containing protein [Tychonema sp. LEGE 07203]|uniref:mCpol domain-containing protein n=1 Tax=Tychonema sp. LEGE 07203 TaxID=1828671 RepID=UPI00187E5770|nr:mCpol domain-containing protein [Tychonema sp. LEGE 07203]MBE9092446.1 mCpol domain-containing protein [Tychonema sp. LEGE 07203]